METDRRKLSNHSINELLEQRSHMLIDQENQSVKPTPIMPSFIIKYKLRLPPAPDRVSRFYNLRPNFYQFSTKQLSTFYR